MPHTSQCTWLTVNLIKTLETAQNNRLNRMSNLRASWSKKITLWVSYNSNTTRAVPHLLYNGSPASWYKLLNPLVTAIWAARWLLNSRLPFSDSKIRSMWPCTVMKAIVHRKCSILTWLQAWQNLMCTSVEWTHIWKSIVEKYSLFLYRSGGISGAVHNSG